MNIQVGTGTMAVRCPLFQTTKVYRIEKKSVPKAVALRKKWKKFGNAADDGDGPNTAQTMVADEVYLQLTTNKEVRAGCTLTTTHEHSPPCVFLATQDLQYDPSSFCCHWPMLLLPDH